MAKVIDMTEGEPTKLLINFAVPLLIGNLFQQGYSLADRIIVGQFVGDNAFSAIGATNAPSQMFMSMCMGMSLGVGVVVAQYFGARDRKNTAAAIINGLYACLILVFITTALALALTKPLLTLLNTPESLMSGAAAYMYIYLGGLVATAAYYTPFSILRALGDSKTPLIFLAVCSILNIILDLIFVIPLKMGVVGAAVATVAAQLVSAVLCFIYAVKNVPQFKMAFDDLSVNRVIISKTLRIGIPTGLQYSFIYVSSVVLQRIVNGFGEDVIGAFTATTQIEILVQQIFAALGAAMVTYTGQNFGAGKKERIALGMKSAMKISLFVFIGLLAVFFAFGDPIMSVFVKNENIISISSKGIKITALFFFALGAVQVLRYLLNGAGDSIYAMINGIIEVAARIGFAAALTSIPFIRMWGIWITTGLTWTVTAVFAFIRYKSGAWSEKSLISERSSQ